MRAYIVCGLLLSGFGGYGYLWSQRPMSAQSLPHVKTTGVAAKAPTRAAARRVSARAPSPRLRPAPRKPPKPPLDRPLRVIGLGWEVVAPAMVANRGATPRKDGAFGAQNLALHLQATERRKRVEEALALGGKAEGGADIALMSLPDFVASFERLQALRPEIFFVAGWSRGQARLFARRRHTLRWLWRRRRVSMVAAPETPSAFVGYFVLDLLGVSPDRVRLLLPTHPRARKAHLTALPSHSKWRHLTRRRKLLLSTAHADHLVPYVAVAPRGFLRRHPRAVTAWLRGWLKGVTQLQHDVPAAARRIATISGAPGALDLLKRLGQRKMISLRENASLFGLSGRSPLTLQDLFATHGGSGDRSA